MNIDDVLSGAVGLRHACSLTACLPRGSLVLGKIDKTSSLSIVEDLLWAILNTQLKKPIDPFEQVPVKEEKKKTYTSSEMMDLLSRPRMEVNNGD